MPTIEEVINELRTLEDIEFGTGVDEPGIRDVEARLGVSIPPEYRVFLREFGYLAIDDLEVFGSGHDVPRHLDVVNVAERERFVLQPDLPLNLIPLSNDGAGNYYVLRTDVTDAPVAFWDHELGRSQVPEPVAGSFSEWLQREVAARRG